MSFSMGDDLEDLGSYLRIEQPEANNQSRQISYEDRKTPPEGYSQTRVNEAWVVGRSATAPDRSKKRRLPEETTTQDAGSAAEPLVGSRPRRAARDAAMATIRQAVVEPEVSAAAGRAAQAGAESQYGGGSDDDDDGQGGGGVGRRGRKNERERQRRLEVNEGFERLGTIVAVERRFKAEKAVVLQKAIEEILSLRQQVTDLRALLVGVGSAVASLGSGTVLTAEGAAPLVAAIQPVIPFQAQVAQAPLAAPVAQLPGQARQEQQPLVGAAAMPSSAPVTLWGPGTQFATSTAAPTGSGPAAGGQAMQEDVPGVKASTSTTGGGRKRASGSSTVQLDYGGYTPGNGSGAGQAVYGGGGSTAAPTSASMAWPTSVPVQASAAQTADAYGHLKTAPAHPALPSTAVRVSSMAQPPAQLNAGHGVPVQQLAAGQAGLEYGSRDGTTVSADTAQYRAPGGSSSTSGIAHKSMTQANAAAMYRNKSGSFGDVFDLHGRAEIAPTSGLLPPVPGLYSESQGHGPGAFVVHRGDSHQAQHTHGVPYTSPATARSAGLGVPRTGPASIVDGLDMEHLHLTEMGGDIGSGLAALPGLGDPFVDDGGLSAVLPGMGTGMFSEMNNHFYQNSLGMGGSHMRHGNAGLGAVSGAGMGGTGGGLMAASMGAYR